MSLLCALLSRLEILFLSLSAVSVKNRGTAFNGDTVNGVIFVNSNVNTFGYSFLPARNNNSNRFKECISKNGFFTEEI